MSITKNSFKELEAMNPSFKQTDSFLSIAVKVEEKVNGIKKDLEILKLIKDRKKEEFLELDKRISEIELSIIHGIPSSSFDQFEIIKNTNSNFTKFDGEVLSTDEIYNVLSLLKYQLFEKVGKDELDIVFSIIDKKIKKNAPIYNEIFLLKSQYSRIVKLLSKSLIEYQNYFLEANRITNSLIKLISNIDISMLLMPVKK